MPLGMGLGLTQQRGGVSIPIPDAPSNLSTVNVTVNDFGLSWDAVTYATSYHVDISESEDFSSFITGFEDKTVNITSVGISELSEYTTYYCRVRAVNDSGTSGNSDTLTQTTLLDHFIALPATNIDADSFYMNWLEPDGLATNYTISVNTQIDFSGDAILDVEIGYGFKSYDVTGLLPDTDYFYRVGFAGGYDWSNIITVHTLPE